MTDEQPTGPERPGAPLPRPISLAFAAVFVAAMVYSLVTDGDPKVIIGLGAFALLALGIDLGSLLGRK